MVKAYYSDASAHQRIVEQASKIEAAFTATAWLWGSVNAASTAPRVFESRDVRSATEGTDTEIARL